jgi:hypothetical protein
VRGRRCVAQTVLATVVVGVVTRSGRAIVGGVQVRKRENSVGACGMAAACGSCVAVGSRKCRKLSHPLIILDLILAATTYVQHIATVHCNRLCASGLGEKPRRILTKVRTLRTRANDDIRKEGGPFAPRRVMCLQCHNTGYNAPDTLGLSDGLEVFDSTFQSNGRPHRFAVFEAQPADDSSLVLANVVYGG